MVCSLLLFSSSFPSAFAASHAGVSTGIKTEGTPTLALLQYPSSVDVSALQIISFSEVWPPSLR